MIEPAADPDDVVRSVRALSDNDLHHLADVVRQVQIERAIDSGDHDTIIAAGFESGFGRDGLGVLPWVEGSVIVCPGGMVSKSKTSHRCVALVPLVGGTELDVVSGKSRSGQHSVDHVVSYEVRGGELVEVSQRNVKPANMR